MIAALRGSVVAALLLCAGTAAAGPRLELDTPMWRPPATEALAHMADDGVLRSDALADAVLAGEIPEHLRRLVPVRFSAADADGRVHLVEVWVTPDYLAVGNDRDAVYAPMGLPSARRVARSLDALLPTPALSDRIHAAATKLEPAPIPPSDRMRTTAVLFQHQDMVEADLPARGTLVAGHKKDVVLTARLAQQPDRVAIYGWHHPDGTPIQPVSLWHGSRYADYSHGVRLVSRTMRIDGQKFDLAEVLADPMFYSLVADEPLPTELLATFLPGAGDEREDAAVVLASR